VSGGGRRPLLRSLLLALGFVAAACLNPKTDDLPVEGGSDGFSGQTGVDNPPGAAGSAGSNAGVGSGGTTAGSAAGSGGGAGAGGTDDDGDAGVPDDAGPPFDDASLSQDGGDAGTQ
jgi:hypothetical protein